MLLIIDKRRLYCTSVDICEIRWRIKRFNARGRGFGGCVGDWPQGWEVVGWGMGGGVWCGCMRVSVHGRAMHRHRESSAGPRALRRPSRATCAQRSVNSICPRYISCWKLSYIQLRSQFYCAVMLVHYYSVLKTLIQVLMNRKME